MKKLYFYYFLSLFILLVDCKKKTPTPPANSTPTSTPAVKPPEPLQPVVLIYPSVGKSQVVELKAGETISLLAQRVYGDRSYGELILALNQITNPRKLRVGAEINLPSFQEIFTQAGLWAKLEPELTKLLQARQLFTEEESALRKLTRTPKPNRDLSLPLTPMAEQKLKKAETLVQEAIKGIESKKAQFTALPEKTLSQLSQLQEALHRLSLGVCNAECKELDLVHQKMAFVLRYLLAWAKAGYK